MSYDYMSVVNSPMVCLVMYFGLVLLEEYCREFSSLIKNYARSEWLPIFQIDLDEWERNRPCD